MWKLLMWRSPLKVLIFYDYLEEEKAKHPNLDAWLEKKAGDATAHGNRDARALARVPEQRVPAARRMRAAKRRAAAVAGLHAARRTPLGGFVSRCPVSQIVNSVSRGCQSRKRRRTRA